MLDDQLIRAYEELGLVDWSAIKYHIRPTGYLAKEIFHGYRDKLLNPTLLSRGASTQSDDAQTRESDMEHERGKLSFYDIKEMMNSFIGCLGIMETASLRGAVCNNIETALLSCGQKTRTIKCLTDSTYEYDQLHNPSEENGLYMIVDGETKPKYETSRILNHDIVNEATYRLIHAEQQAIKQEARVLGMKVDAIYVDKQVEIVSPF